MTDRPTNAPLRPITRKNFLKLSAAAAGSTLVGAGSNAMASLPKLDTRPIPSSGEPLPIVGFGTWQTFDIGDNPTARAEREDVLRLLFEAGGKLIDSSPMYGRSEGVVGDLLAKMGARDKAFLATKVWTWGRDQGIGQMEQSMTRFKTDTIDLMQIHNLVDWRTHLKTLRAWKEQKRFRYIGITHYTDAALNDLMEVMRSEPVDFVQMAYSIRVRNAEERLLPLAADKGIAVIVNRPYEGGGAFRAVRGEPLPEWAAEFGIASWGQFFLKYILSNPAVTCVIPGTGKVKYAVDNLGAGHGRLPDAATRAKMIEVMTGD
jgi:aryl-alcohol dehydrogenase-like predicted oxidoreductase